MQGNDRRNTRIRNEIGALAARRLVQLSVFVMACSAAVVQGQDDPVSNSLLPTGRLIQPAGTHQVIEGRPVDVALNRSGELAFAKDRQQVRILAADSLTLLHSVAIPGGASLTGLEVGDSGRVYVTNAAQELVILAATSPDADSKEALARSYSIEKQIAFDKGAFPCGLALTDDESKAFVCLSKQKAVAIVELASESVETIDVGVAPFDVVLDENKHRLFVSNLGGRRSVEGDTTAPSAGTETVVDDRGIAASGTVSVVDLTANKVTHEVATGLHPTSLALAHDGRILIVANTNEDSLSLIDTEEWETTTQVVKPDENLPFGSMPSAIAVDDEQSRVYVTLAGNNAVAVLKLNQDHTLESQGFIPTGWYPAAIELSNAALYVANIKGVGSRADVREPEKGRNSHDHLGSVQRVEVATATGDELAQLTDQVRSNGKIPQILRAYERRESADDEQSLPAFPEKLGEPSRIEHIIYVIKENRTYDQVFGDLEESRAEPSLCTFPEEITPNHHALAKRFGILDNYYCNGVLSADGHSWATEGNVTPYLERAFGGFSRSYTFGDDPLTYSSSGFLWDHVLAGGYSFRNYGEMDYAKPPEGMLYQEIWKAYEAGEKIEFEQNIGIEKLRRYSSRNYPGWNMSIPDVLRIDRFLEEFREFEKEGGLPNVCLVYLPQDHLGGGVTSQAHMADNDLAVGRLVEAVSQSKYWEKSAIFVIEDDPQNGYDHIDGHRSICLVVSPYSKPGVNHNFYNQTSVLRSMLHILGLPPMNQQDASAPLMNDCFQEQGDFSPYVAKPVNVPLNQTAAAVEKQSDLERKWRAILATVPIERTGMKTEEDEDNLNRFVWHEVKGWTTPYPIEWAGAHGRGLKSLGLVIDEEADDDD